MELEGTTSVDRSQRSGQPREISDLFLLRAQRQIARRHLPFLKTLADFDIACEVGFHELSGRPLTVKHLMLLEIAPAVTVFRRLERLCSCGVILRSRSQRDGRVHELRLAPAVHRLFAMYVRVENDPADQFDAAQATNRPVIEMR